MRRQKLLIDQMQAVCPNLSSTRWSSMSRVSKFLVERRSEIMEYLDQTDVSQKIRKTPSLSWWIVLAVISELSGQVSECVERLQGRRITLQQQKSAVESLLTSLKRLAYIQPATDQLDLYTTEEVFTFEQWQVSHADLIGLIQDQGLFEARAFGELYSESTAEVLQAIGDVLLKTVANLSTIEAWRDELNQASPNLLPPYLPQELAAIKTRELVQIVLDYHDRLIVTWKQKDIDQIVEQHKQLLVAVNREQRLANALGRLTEQSDFSDTWSIPGIKDRFPQLIEFCGGLASPFPNTVPVESDFSILKWEKDIHRSKISPFFLEGVLHCRQIRTLLKRK